MLRVVTLCSGYDSQCLALERLKQDFPPFDYELVAWSEFDPQIPNVPLERQPAVIAHNALFPQWADRNLGDMTKIDWTKVPDFDLLTYSTPCQSISQAGLQHGFTEGSGTRSSIIWNVRDALRIKHPRYALLENVAAMVSAKFLPMFNLWRKEVESLGYHCWAALLNAKDYGIPQNRLRIYMVSDNQGDSFHFPEAIPLERLLKDMLEQGVDTKYYLDFQKTQDFVRDNIKMIQDYARQSTDPILPLPDHLAQWIKKQGCSIPDTTPSSPSSPVDASMSGIPTLSEESEGASPAPFIFDVNGTQCIALIRKLTERECFRLMGLTDEQVDRIQTTGLARSHQYKLAGNSIVVDNLYHIFRKMLIDPTCESQQLSLF